MQTNLGSVYFGSYSLAVSNKERNKVLETSTYTTIKKSAELVKECIVELIHNSYNDKEDSAKALKDKYCIEVYEVKEHAYNNDDDFASFPTVLDFGRREVIEFLYCGVEDI